MDAVLPRPSPLTEHVQLVEATYVNEDLKVLANVVVDRDNPILAGHYPGMPIFPGVCLIECAHHAVLLAARSQNHEAALEAVPSARFLDTVLPSDAVSIHVRIATSQMRWRAVARLHSERGLAAKVTLVYRMHGTAPCTD